MTADTFRPASFRAVAHDHVFLDDAHQRSERKVWAVIGLCVAMMMVEIGGGLYFGSIALVADGLHMSTHAGALLLAALAYTYARRHAHDPRFSFGTGKLGDLAGFTSATILAMIALLIGYEAVSRILSPVPIHFGEAIPIACLGLAVNVASAWLLGGGDHHHGHGHGHGHSHAHGHSHSHAHGETHSHDETHRIPTRSGTLALELFEDGVPPRFRLRAETGPTPAIASASMSSLIETIRPDGSRQRFTLVDRGTYLESLEEVPEPHDFVALLRIDGGEHALTFEEPDTSDDAHRDNNMRAALVHVVADAAVSVLVIVGLVLAQSFGWLWMDPLAGVVGAAVIASWSYGLIRDTGTILLDITPDRRLLDSVRDVIEDEGDALTDLHVWRLGPGHLGAIVSVRTDQRRGPDHYRAKLARFRWLSHLTVEVQSV